MKKHIIKTVVLSLFTTVAVAAPALSYGQDAGTNAPATSVTSTTPAPATSDQTAPAKPKRRGLVFHGTVSMVDTNAMAFTVGKRTFNVTSETRITKNGEPATLEDITVGDKVGGAYKKDDDGKFNATTVHDGKKTASDMPQ
jgi:Domain of unknown function (DUF5666)